VLLLSNPVVGGYVQNPISVYYCFDAAGKLAKCIAEVRPAEGPAALLVELNHIYVDSPQSAVL